MTQEEKQLLLIDLCERLLYGVKVEINGVKSDPLGCELIGVLGKAETVYAHLIPASIPIEEVKPYLRPMSSMTKEERAERVAILWELEGHIDEDVTYKYQDWLLSHHFDFRNLIGKGLALEAPKDMYEFL